MFNKVLIFSFFTATLAACSNLQSTNPNPRTEIPELPAANSWGFQLEGVSAHSYEATGDASARPVTNKPKLTKSASFSGGVNYSPYDALSVGLELDPIHFSLSAVGKYQFLGAGHSEPGHFTGLLHARFGTGATSKKGDQKGEFGPGGYPWKGSINNQFAMAGVSLGYRLNEKILAYIGNSYGSYNIKTSITQDAANGDAGGSYNFNDKGRAETIGGGIVFGMENASLLILGVDYAHVDYGGTTEVFDTAYRIGLVF